jgi:hypothetical protein
MAVDTEAAVLEDRGDDHAPTEEKVTAEDLKKVGIEPEKAEAESEKAEAAEAEDGAEGEEKKAAKARQRIPLERHEQILARERERREALERELAASRQGQQISATNEQITAAEEKLLSLESDHARLVTDGDAEKAAKVMGEIRRLERGIVESKSTLAIQAAEARAYERVRYDTMVERLETAYPTLNPDHAEYDEALTAEVVELRDAYVATGRYSRADAIQKAAKTVLGANTARQERAVTSDVRVSSEDVAKATAAERAKAARMKAADAASKQPPNIGRIGVDSDKMGGALDAKAVIKMSQDDFAKLDEKTLARLRGDELA